MFFIHFISNQFKLEQKYWIDCEEMCLLYSNIKYGNLAWHFIWDCFPLISYCRILIWEQVSWSYFPSVGVTKPLYLIMKEKIWFSEKKIPTLWSMSSQCCLSVTVLQSSPDFSSVQTDQWIAPVTCRSYMYESHLHGWIQGDQPTSVKKCKEGSILLHKNTV